MVVQLGNDDIYYYFFNYMEMKFQEVILAK